MKKGLVAVLILVFILVGCETSVDIDGIEVFKQGDVIEVTRLDREGYYEEYQAVLKAIDNWYALKERKNISKEVLDSTFNERAVEIDNPIDYLELMMELFATLDNGHTRVFEYRRADLVKAIEIDGRFYVQNIDEQSQLAEHGVKIGWEVLSIDDTPVKEWTQNRMKYYGGNSSKQRRELELDIFMRQPFDSEIRNYMMRDLQGNIHHFEISFEHNFGKFISVFNENPVNHMVIDDSKIKIGYIAINTMSGEAYSIFEAVIKDYLTYDALIIDLRENGGGSSLEGDKMFSHFISEPTHGWSTKGYGGRPHQPAEDNFFGKLIVLISHKTFSAAESFAFDLYELDNSVFIGDVTGGCSGGGPQSFVTDSGLGFAFPTRGVDYSVSGVEMEGPGLMPDYIVKQTYSDLIENIDTVLSFAIEYVYR